LILIMETSQLVSRDINAILKGNRLILEAPLISSYNKPFRTHLIDKVNSNEIDDGLMLIGFTEVTLKSGYRYQLISCQVIDSRLIKVTLGFRPWGRDSGLGGDIIITTRKIIKGELYFAFGLPE